MKTSEMSDRDLCLGLAERLGWEPNVAIDPEQVLMTVPLFGRTVFHCEWLLTPAGCFAVLEAMRERGWEFNCRDGLLGWDVTYARFDAGDQRLLDVRHERLGRAICEAAYSALGASDER